METRKRGDNVSSARASLPFPIRAIEDAFYGPGSRRGSPLPLEGTLPEETEGDTHFLNPPG